MTATENITRMKIKIKIGSKAVGSHPVTKQYQLNQGQVLGNESCRSMSMSLCNKPEMIKPQNFVIPSSETIRDKLFSVGSKRKLSVAGDGQKEKKRKMDRTVTQQCAVLLKHLMNHPAGWVFKEPVDPVKLQIPDYHDIITQPMDLGTVKAKLNKNQYSSVDEFAAHVRLTFSNAMTYNPPSNNVHVMAEELKAIFDTEWGALEAKWSGERKNFSRVVKCTDISGKSGTKKPPSCENLKPKSLISTVEKQKLRDRLLNLVRGNLPSHLQLFLRKIGVDLKSVERIEEIVDTLAEEDLWELQKIASSSWVVQTAKVSPAKEPEHVGQQSRVKITPKGTDNGIGNASGSADFIPPPKSVTSKCGVCHSMRCECNKQRDKARSSSDILSEGARDYLDVSMRDRGTKIQANLQLRKSEPGTKLQANLPLRKSEPGTKLQANLQLRKPEPGTKLQANLQLRKSEPESKGSASVLKEDFISSCPPLLTTNTTSTTSTSAEGCAAPVDCPLSPQKALRAALLKSRFADTILKAKQKALLDHGNKSDPAKLQKEKERLKREQQEERARIEAQIKASEEAARKRAEAERKMQREREREAARLALQQMVKTVEIDNDHKILKDLELLSGCSLSDQLSCVSCESSPEVASAEKGCFVKVLEQLGLFMKDDYMEDEDEETNIISAQVEEGEIIF